MPRIETDLDRTYDSLDEDDALNLIRAHYGEGINGYSFWAELPTALKALWLGIENVPSHPAQLHYAWLNNRDGQPNNLDLNEGIRLATTTAIELLQLDYNEPIIFLDAGCGIGGAVLQIDLFLQEQPVVSFELHGISIVLDQVKLARLRSSKLGAINSNFIVGDCLNLPYESAYFTSIIAFETFCHIPPVNKLSLLRGLFRVLEPGGRVAILDAYFIKKPETPAEHHWFNIFRNGWTLPELVTVEEMNNLAGEAGFDIETSFCALDEVRPSIKIIDRRARFIGKNLLRIYRTLKRLGHESKLLRRTGVHSANAEAFVQACIAQKEVVDRGLLTYHVHVLKKPHTR